MPRTSWSSLWVHLWGHFFKGITEGGYPPEIWLVPSCDMGSQRERKGMKKKAREAPTFYSSAFGLHGRWGSCVYPTPELVTMPFIISPSQSTASIIQNSSPAWVPRRTLSPLRCRQKRACTLGVLLVRHVAAAYTCMLVSLLLSLKPHPFLQVFISHSAAQVWGKKTQSMGFDFNVSWLHRSPILFSMNILFEGTAGSFKSTLKDVRSEWSIQCPRRH